MLRCLAIRVLSTAVLAASAISQSLLVVDPGALPGQAFASIDDAVTAAAPGDTIFVRAGNYGPLRLGKGITIVADPNVILVGGIEIRGVPAGERAVVRGVRTLFSHPSQALGLTIANNQGQVFLEDVVHDAFEGAVVDTNSRVGFTRCEIHGGPQALTVSNSEVHITSSQLVPGPSANMSPAPTAISCRTSLVILTDSTASGAMVTGLFGRTAPGIELFSGTMRLAGRTRVTAGYDTTSNPTEAIATFGGTLYVAPTTTLASTNGGPLITGPVTPIPEALATVTTSRANWGQSFGIQTCATIPSSFATFIQAPAPRMPTLFGDLWGDGPLTVIHSGAYLGLISGGFAFGIPQSVPLGTLIGLQAVTLSSAGGIEFSTPTIAVVGR